MKNSNDMISLINDKVEQGVDLETAIRLIQKNALTTLTVKTLFFYGYNKQQTCNDTPLYAFKEHTSYVEALAILPDGTFLSGGRDSKIRHWDIKTKICLQVFEGHTSDVCALAILPDGTFLSGSQDNTIRHWDIKTKTCLQVFEGHTNTVRALAILPDGTILSGSYDHTIRHWEIQTKSCLHICEGHTNWVHALAVLPDGTFLSGSEDKTIRHWNIKADICLRVFKKHTDGVTALAILPDGMFLSGSRDKTIRHWNIKADICLRVFKKHTNDVTALAILPDGTFLSGSWDRTIRHWDIQTKICLHEFKRDMKPVYAMAASPDGTFLIGDGGGNVYHWAASLKIPQPLDEKHILELLNAFLQTQPEQSTLTTLDLSTIKLTNAIFSVLLKLLPHLKKLEELDLRDTALTEPQLIELIKYFKQFNSPPPSGIFSNLFNFLKKVETNPIKHVFITESNFKPELVRELKELLGQKSSDNDNKDLSNIGNSNNNIHIISSNNNNNIDIHIDHKPNLIKMPPIQKITEKQITVVKKLAQGAQGIVYLATLAVPQGNETVYQDIVIKVPKMKSQDPIMQLQWKKELHVLKNINHPTILHLLGEMDSQNPEISTWIVLPYMEKGNLLKLVINDNEIFSWQQRLTISEDAANGLAYLHKNHIIHRDMKAENILIDAYYRAKIADFGIVRVESNITSTFVGDKLEPVFGTEAYLAPELTQYKLHHKKINLDSAPYTETSDVYALGVIFWEIASRYSAARMMLCGFLSIPTDAPLIYQQWIKNCFNRMPNARPTAAVLYEQVANQDTQQKIINEVEKTSQKSSSQISIEAPKDFLYQNEITIETLSLKQESLPEQNLSLEKLSNSTMENEKKDTMALETAVTLLRKNQLSALRFNKIFFYTATSQIYNDAPLHEFREKNAKVVTVLAVLPDGTFLSVSNNRTIHHRDTLKKEYLHEFNEHTGGVFALTVLPDGTFLSGSFDKTIRHWDIKTNTCLQVFEGHTESITALAVLPDGTFLSGSLDHTIRHWDIKTNTCLQVFEGHTDYVGCLATLPDGTFLSGSNDRTICHWDVKTNTCLQVFDEHCDYVKCLAILPDGTFLSGSDDRTIRHWDTKNEASLQVFLTPHARYTEALAILHDGTFLSGGDSIICHWDVKKKTLLHVFMGHTGPVHALATLPDGTFLAGTLDVLCKEPTGIFHMAVPLKTANRLDEKHCLELLDSFAETQPEQSTLTTLDLSTVTLTEEIFTALLKLLPRLERLEELDLRETSLSEAQLIELIHYLKAADKHSIKHILISENTFKSSLVNDLNEALKDKKSDNKEKNSLVIIDNIIEPNNNLQNSINIRSLEKTESHSKTSIPHEQISNNNSQQNNVEKIDDNKQDLSFSVHTEAPKDFLRKEEKIIETLSLQKPPLSIKKNPLLEQTINLKKIVSPTFDNKSFDEIPYDQLKIDKNVSLGEGSFGVVYKGVWLFDPVAIKQLHAHKLNEKQLNDFRQELNYLIQLRHPNIVFFRGACTKDTYAIVMEFCEKGSLYNVLHNPQELLSSDIKINIAIDMGKGLCYLHKLMVIHRDIKSHNILLDEHYKAKITDFGLSKTKEYSASMTQTKLGTLYWMAPELFDMEVNYSFESDMYAYGMVLWETNARKLPYEAAKGNQQRVMGFKMKNQHDKIPDDTPLKLAHLIKWCWKSEPKERPSAEKAVEYLQLKN